MAVDPGKLRVLLVDDGAERRRLMRTLLSSVGIRDVVIAGNAAEALASLGRQNLDLMLVDHDLEGGKAIAFVRELRASWESPAPELPVILVASADRPTILAARDAGVTEFLARPASAGALLARLEEIVERPRPFVRVEKYVGPCRRRRKLEQWAGVERRGRGAPAAPTGGPGGQGRG